MRRLNCYLILGERGCGVKKYQNYDNNAAIYGIAIR
jgi:hypothetical protein